MNETSWRYNVSALLAVGIIEPPAGETQQIPSVFATGGLTQKQSLRGLLLVHYEKLYSLGVGVSTYFLLKCVVKERRDRISVSSTNNFSGILARLVQPLIR